MILKYSCVQKRSFYLKSHLNQQESKLLQISWCQIQSSFFSTTQEIGLPNWKHHHKCNTIGYHHTSTICWGVLYYVGAASNTDTSSPPSEISFTIGEDSPMQHRHCLSPPKIPAVLSHMKFKHLLHDKL